MPRRRPDDTPSVPEVDGERGSAVSVRRGEERVSSSPPGTQGGGTPLDPFPTDAQRHPSGLRVRRLGLELSDLLSERLFLLLGPQVLPQLPHLRLPFLQGVE